MPPATEVPGDEAHPPGSRAAVRVADVREEVTGGLVQPLARGGHVDGVTITRVGTQVVVRLSGTIDDARAARLRAALAEVATLALSRVVIDLTEATAVSGAGVDFLLRADERWNVRLLDPPSGLRQHLAAAREDLATGPGPRRGGGVAV